MSRDFLNIIVTWYLLRFCPFCGYRCSNFGWTLRVLFAQSGSHTLASLELRFIDEESHEVRVGPVRSCSVGFLNQVTTGAPVDTGTTKRLVLTTRKPKHRTEPKSKTPAQVADTAATMGEDLFCFAWLTEMPGLCSAPALKICPNNFS